MNYDVEYVRGGINKIKQGFETFEDAEKWAEENDLVFANDPERENEYRIVR